MRAILCAVLLALSAIAGAGAAEVDNAALAAELRKAEAAARADRLATGLDEALAAYYAGTYSGALAQLTGLADDGSAEAMHWLGVVYQTGEGFPADLKVAARWYEEAADKDFAPSEYRLAVMHEFGEAVEKDAERAVELYRAAAEQGHVDAQRNLAFAYERGWGVEMDLAKAFRWYQRASDQGDPDAFDAVRRLAREPLPEGVELDALGEAMAHYYRGEAFRAVSGFIDLAEEEDPAGQAWLGYLSEIGFGTPRNLARAAGLYAAAAAANEQRALIGLATMYYQGEPMAEDLGAAAALFGVAARQGGVLAQFNLAYMYETGAGVPADQTLAIRWYRRAAALGYDEAAAELKRLGQ